MKLTLLLGAEGVSETEGQPWIREATAEEAEEFRDFYGGSDVMQELGLDRTGRPYWLMTLTEETPPEILEANRGYGRMVRLRRK